MTNNKKAIVTAVMAIAISFEGLRQYAYYDPAGILTVCYGTTGPEVVKGKKYSLAECKAFLEKDVLEAIATVERCHPGMPDSVVVAFADAVYNIGPKVACASTASNYLGVGNYAAACNQLPRWNKATVAGVLVELPGLTKRRLLEKEICLSGLEIKK